MDEVSYTACGQDLDSDNSGTDLTEGSEEISFSDEFEGVSFESEAEIVEETEGVEDTEPVEGVVGGCNFDAVTSLNGIDDIGAIDFRTISAEDVMRFHFPDVDVAFIFYNWYASVHGFAARKSKLMRNSHGEVTQQTFLCHKEGLRDANRSNSSRRMRRPKPVTRCGCEARCMVHLERHTGRWYIKLFDDVHNHTLMDKNFSTMLPAHRKMSDYDKYQMTNMRKVGIKTSHIYGLFASQAGGYDKVGYMKRDMYNEEMKQKRSKFTDAKAALDYLEGKQLKDEMLFWRHTVDDNGRLEHLFWCDGVGRRDFSVFGDVLAFDATYRKNKYLCPFVVFSGVNHHNQSIVFATAIVVKETEKTYVWVLEQFLTAMEGKAPVSIITDGDVAMRNAIKRVFPLARHRLCAWHLLRNATSHIKDPKFVTALRACMLGDYDVGEFQSKWDKLVSDFGLQENEWVKDLYDKRGMWAAAHIRGNFFAGFRTTSRCEGLHSEFGKYVDCQDSLVEFLEHFFRWLNYMRYREVEADFYSAYGEPVTQTQLRCLEKSAADVYTREIFMLFCPVLERALSCKVVGIRQTASCFLYTVTKYRRADLEWRVSFSPSSLEFKCSCERFESIGIPCEHLIKVIFHLDIVVLPECLVLKRWTKAAKDSVAAWNDSSYSSAEPGLIRQHMGIVERCKRMAKAAVKTGSLEHVRKTAEMVTRQTEMLESLYTDHEPTTTNNDPLVEGCLGNPARARHKGCGTSNPAPAKGRQTVHKARTCGVCGVTGHNRKSCHVQREIDLMMQSQPTSNDVHEDDYVHGSSGFDNIDMGLLD